MEKQIEKINEAANNWNRTKDTYYKELWYKLIKEFANGSNNIERRTVSTTSSDKKDNGRNRPNS